MRLGIAAALVTAFVAPALFAPLRAAADPADSSREVEAAVLAEINFARTHPQEYALQLRQQPVTEWEAALRAGGDDQDPGAYEEAIAFLMRQAPLAPLQPDAGLREAALEHVALQGPAGEVGHEGPNGERFDLRIRRHGVAGETVAENIAYGPPQPRDVVRELIIDRGVASRGHRRNIFTPGLQAAGVECGPHKVYDTMCVIDFASGAGDRSTRQAAVDDDLRDPVASAQLSRSR